MLGALTLTAFVFFGFGYFVGWTVTGVTYKAEDAEEKAFREWKASRNQHGKEERI